MSDVLNKMMSLIGRDDEGGSDKDVLLKHLVKEIAHNKYAKFFRPRHEEADASLGQYFFGIYKAIFPLQTFLRDPAVEVKIRQIALEAFLDKPTMDIIKRLSPDKIAERRKTSGEDLPRILQEDLAALAAGFDSPRIAAADRCYDLIAAMKQFVFFDFLSLVRKFDPEIREGDFVSQQKFVPVDAGILSADLASFLSVLPPTEGDHDWKTVFEVLKYCKGGSDVIPPALWNNVLASLGDLKASKILELINRIATRNPILEIKAIHPHESLSAQWLEQKNEEVREVIQGIAGNQRHSQINTLEQAVFGSISTNRLQYYTPEKGRPLEDKSLDTFIYSPALNHLAAFISEFLSKDMYELCDILLVRGQWTNHGASRQMSESFHEVTAMTQEINTLDETLAETGSNGPRLRGALLRVDRDKSQVRYINSIVGSINDEALEIINQAVPALIVVGKHFKMLLEDCEKKQFELVMNWKELGLVSKTPMNERLAGAYKKINYFVQLMILETKNIE
ncbi:MAG: DUF5312 family protein [Treponema sp.]|nr:DUF5312 family protein [Treponema sp.]